MNQVPNPRNSYSISSITGWWFQPIWKILVKMGIFPKYGMKIKNIWNHHLDYGREKNSHGFIIYNNWSSAFVWTFPAFFPETTAVITSVNIPSYAYTWPSSWRVCEVPSMYAPQLGGHPSSWPKPMGFHPGLPGPQNHQLQWWTIWNQVFEPHVAPNGSTFFQDVCGPNASFYLPNHLMKKPPFFVGLNIFFGGDWYWPEFYCNSRMDTSCPVPACMTRISDHLNFSEIRPPLGNSYVKLHLNEIIPKHFRHINSIILGYFGCIRASPIFPISSPFGSFWPYLAPKKWKQKNNSFSILCCHGTRLNLGKALKWNEIGMKKEQLAWHATYTHTIHETGIFTDPWMVDFDDKCR